jgi:hypothetical protein
VQGAEPPVLVVVGTGFFFRVVVVPWVVDGAIGEVGVGMDTAVAVDVVSRPLESEPHPASSASSAAALSTMRRDRPTRIGPAM